MVCSRRLTVLSGETVWPRWVIDVQVIEGRGSLPQIDPVEGVEGGGRQPEETVYHHPCHHLCRPARATQWSGPWIGQTVFCIDTAIGVSGGYNAPVQVDTDQRAQRVGSHRQEITVLCGVMGWEAASSPRALEETGQERGKHE